MLCARFKLLFVIVGRNPTLVLQISARWRYCASVVHVVLRARVTTPHTPPFPTELYHRLSSCSSLVVLSLLFLRTFFLRSTQSRSSWVFHSDDIFRDHSKMSFFSAKRWKKVLLYYISKTEPFLWRVQCHWCNKVLRGRRTHKMLYDARYTSPTW